jgi:hypothetical protein
MRERVQVAHPDGEALTRCFNVRFPHALRVISQYGNRQAIELQFTECGNAPPEVLEARR